MIILGIDPGSLITGYGVIHIKDKAMIYVESGCIRTQGTLENRLLDIFNGICELLEKHNPEEVAIEQVFMHANVSSALKLGHARGAAMVACASHRLKINEYSARFIKQAIVGYGAAEKKQVKHMVVELLQLGGMPQQDAADALAVAICHVQMRKYIHSQRRRK